MLLLRRLFPTDYLYGGAIESDKSMISIVKCVKSRFITKLNIYLRNIMI